MAALELPPDLRDFRRLNVAAVRSPQGRYPEAIEAPERVGASGEEVPLLHYQWATTLLETGRFAEALEHARAYERLLGGDPEVDGLVGRALAGLGREARPGKR